VLSEIPPILSWTCIPLRSPLPLNKTWELPLKARYPTPPETLPVPLPADVILTLTTASAGKFRLLDCALTVHAPPPVLLMAMLATPAALSMGERNALPAPAVRSSRLTVLDHAPLTAMSAAHAVAARPR
jgi:hypothetical protein